MSNAVSTSRSPGARVGSIVETRTVLGPVVRIRNESANASCAVAGGAAADRAVAVTAQFSFTTVSSDAPVPPLRMLDENVTS